MIKSQHSTGPATGPGLQPARRGSLSRAVGRQAGLAAAWSSRAAAYAHSRSCASAAWSPRAGRRGSVFADGPTADNRRRGAPQEHQRLFRVTPGKADEGRPEKKKEWSSPYK
jgi:hypothetical protein